MEGIANCRSIRTFSRYGEDLNGVSATDFAMAVFRALIKRGKFDPTLFENLTLGQCHPNGEAPTTGCAAALSPL